MVEIKINRKWARDEEKAGESPRYWRDFEINDYVDVNKNGWKVAVVKKIKKAMVQI